MYMFAMIAQYAAYLDIICSFLHTLKKYFKILPSPKRSHQTGTNQSATIEDLNLKTGYSINWE